MLSHISLPFLLIDDSLGCVTTVSGLKSGVRIRVDKIVCLQNIPFVYWCLCLFTIIPILPWSGPYRKHCGLTYRSFAITWKVCCHYNIDCTRFYWLIFACLHIDVFFTNVQWVLGVCGHFFLQVHILITCLGYK
jgi:hypothetical protein